jgi:Glycosyl hydrolases family 16
MNAAGLITGMFLHRNSPRQEIDIEFIGKDTRKMLVNVFYNPGVEGSRMEYGYRDAPTLIDLGFDASEDFHEYEIEWREGSIRWRDKRPAPWSRPALSARGTLPPTAARQDVQGEESDDNDRRSDSDHSYGRSRDEHPQVISGLAFAKTLAELKAMGPSKRPAPVELRYAPLGTVGTLLRGDEPQGPRLRRQRQPNGTFQVVERQTHRGKRGEETFRETLVDQCVRHRRQPP